MPVLLLIVGLAILVVTVYVALGRGGELSAERPDYAPLDLGPVSAADVALLRPPSNGWGYNKQATDEALDRIAQSVRDRDVRIVALEQLVTDLSRDPEPVALGEPLPGARHRRAVPPAEPEPQPEPQPEADPAAELEHWPEQPEAPAAEAKEPAEAEEEETAQDSETPRPESPLETTLPQPAVPATPGMPSVVWPSTPSPWPTTPQTSGTSQTSEASDAAAEEPTQPQQAIRARDGRQEPPPERSHG